MKRCLLAVLLLVVPTFAQEFRGTISGAITDPSGAAIADAKVTVKETQTGTKVETVSDASGRYTVPFLLPGDYEIAVKVQGFREAIRKAFHLGSGETPVIDVRLELGATSQSVVVTADAPLINSENASVGQ